MCTGLAVLVWMAPRACAVRRLRLVIPTAATVTAPRPPGSAPGTLAGADITTRPRPRLPVMAAVAVGMLVAAAIGGLVGGFVGAFCGIAGGAMGFVHFDGRPIRPRRSDAVRCRAHCRWPRTCLQRASHLGPRRAWR